RLTKEEFVAVTSTNIAKVLNCYPRKGAIRVGSDADIVVWDPAKTKTIAAASQVSAIDYNVFEGKEVKGLPRYTLTRGQVAVTDGVLTSEEGHGKFVERKGGTPTNTALSKWKDLTAPRPVKRSGIPASGPRRMTASPVIQASHLDLTFQTADGPVHALKNVSLDIEKGSFVSFIGPSGCGKTTFLRCIAALEHPTGGSLTVNGMTPDEARRARAYGYVFQAAGLYPWRTIGRNVALPLEIMGYSKAEQAERVKQVLE
ncbi:unnamed protein product, partial [Laminaria digitata]